MKSCLLVLCVILIFGLTGGQTVLAQKYVCSCSAGPKPACSGEAKCSTGCSSICGDNDRCFVSCRTPGFGPNLTLEFKQKTVSEMLGTINEKTRLRIGFAPNEPKKNPRFDYQLKSSDVWKFLEFLDRMGRVKVGSTDFQKLRDLRRAMQSGQPIPFVAFKQLTVEEVVAKLEFTSGADLEIASGDASKLVNLEVRDKKLDELVQLLAESAGVKINMITTEPNR